MIRVGGTRGKNGEYFVDEKFKENITNAKKAGLKVGVYFYSYAPSFLMTTISGAIFSPST